MRSPRIFFVPLTVALWLAGGAHAANPTPSPEAWVAAPFTRMTSLIPLKSKQLM